MEAYEIPGFLGILRECLKAISKNGMLIATITTLSILLKSLPLFTEYYSIINPELHDLLADKIFLFLSDSADNVDPTAHIAKDVLIIDGLGILYMFSTLAIYLFSLVTMIQASVIAYSNSNLSFSDCLSCIPNLCLQVLVTWFHYTLSAVGYFSLFFVLLIFLLIPFAGFPLLLIKFIAILLSFFALIFFIYLAVVWETALVISVVEKSCYGLRAFGEAERLVKGKRLNGFALCFLRFVVLYIFIKSFKSRPNKESVLAQIVWLFFTNAFYCLVDMVYLLSYTVLYFKCKETQGEVELRGSLEYSKLPEIEVAFGKVPV